MNDTNKLVDVLSGEPVGATFKRQFIGELCDNVRDDLLKLVPKMPEEWDGIELRSMIAKRFSEVSLGDAMKDHRSKRYRNYEAECLSRNLW